MTTPRRKGPAGESRTSTRSPFWSPSRTCAATVAAASRCALTARGDDGFAFATRGDATFPFLRGDVDFALAARGDGGSDEGLALAARGDVDFALAARGDGGSDEGLALAARGDGGLDVGIFTQKDFFIYDGDLMEMIGI